MGSWVDNIDSSFSGKQTEGEGGNSGSKETISLVNSRDYGALD